MKESLSSAVPAEETSTRPFDKLSGRRVRAVLGCLTESTFFYREDDRDLFDYLRKNRAEFERFLHQYLDWDLHVDRKCARLFKRSTCNPALTPKQRGLFDLTRREECIVFMLLLEFHEQQLAAQNIHYEHDEDLRFLLSDFVRHTIARFGAELGERCPSDREILGHVRSVFRTLEVHRFLRLVERGSTGDEEPLPPGQTEQELWDVLPGLHCYDPSALTRSIFQRAYGLEEDPT